MSVQHVSGFTQQTGLDADRPILCLTNNVVYNLHHLHHSETALTLLLSCPQNWERYRLCDNYHTILTQYASDQSSTTRQHRAVLTIVCNQPALSDGELPSR